MSPEEVIKYLDDQVNFILNTMEETTDKIIDNHVDNCESNDSYRCTLNYGTEVNKIFLAKLTLEMQKRSASLSVKLAKTEPTSDIYPNLN